MGVYAYDGNRLLCWLGCWHWLLGWRVSWSGPGSVSAQSVIGTSALQCCDNGLPWSILWSLQGVCYEGKHHHYSSIVETQYNISNLMTLLLPWVCKLKSLGWIINKYFKIFSKTLLVLFSKAGLWKVLCDLDNQSIFGSQSVRLWTIIQFRRCFSLSYQFWDVRIFMCAVSLIVIQSRVVSWSCIHIHKDISPWSLINTLTSLESRLTVKVPKQHDQRIYKSWLTQSIC